MMYNVNLLSKNGWQDKRILVTGGAGFIGSWLTEYLVNLGAIVTVIDNLYAGKHSNISNIRKRVIFNKGDIRDFTIVKQVIKDKDVIFHLGANASVPNSIENIDYDFETNVIGTYNILNAVQKSKTDTKIVYASSAAVYGEPQHLPINESHPLNPISPYGASKLCGETYCMAFNRIYNLKTVSLRLFNVYGPRQPRYVIYDFLKKLSHDDKILNVLGTGEQKRDFIYVEDAVQGFLKAAQKKEAVGNIMNIGTGDVISIKQLAEALLKLLGLEDKTLIAYTGSSWKGDVKIFQADISFAKKIMGFKPMTSFDEGLKKEIEWFKKL